MKNKKYRSRLESMRANGIERKSFTSIKNASKDDTFDTKGSSSKKIKDTKDKEEKEDLSVTSEKVSKEKASNSVDSTYMSEDKMREKFNIAEDEQWFAGLNEQQNSSSNQGTNSKTLSTQEIAYESYKDIIVNFRDMLEADKFKQETDEKALTDLPKTDNIKTDIPKTPSKNRYLFDDDRDAVPFISGVPTKSAIYNDTVTVKSGKNRYALRSMYGGHSENKEGTVQAHRTVGFAPKSQSAEKVRLWKEWSMTPHTEDEIREKILTDIDSICFTYMCKYSKMSSEFIEELLALSTGFLNKENYEKFKKPVLEAVQIKMGVLDKSINEVELPIIETYDTKGNVKYIPIASTLNNRVDWYYIGTCQKLDDWFIDKYRAQINKALKITEQQAVDEMLETANGLDSDEAEAKLEDTSESLVDDKDEFDASDIAVVSAEGVDDKYIQYATARIKGAQAGKSNTKPRRKSTTKKSSRPIIEEVYKEENQSDTSDTFDTPEKVDKVETVETVDISESVTENSNKKKNNTRSKKNKSLDIEKDASYILGTGEKRKTAAPKKKKTTKENTDSTPGSKFSPTIVKSDAINKPANTEKKRAVAKVVFNTAPQKAASSEDFEKSPK
jgi:hypothetical protein